ncbi:SprT family zinc-dependent metalloprotease [Zeaxanthinibacter sp. PT1]|uniref:M48 family metallopeptidase n=1 Tax=Zeaxanthinibacter TaxID=561554 RepID=UPI0023490077|nr:SprT family zinc-dependent metalloprotease [Zeaxanthinibacter sp. PT1]MDC6350468.1 SprT family zinc-dependent metalloprotease [Zeaxanthinibacter sp. PT1]
MSEQSIQYGNTIIKFQLDFANRKTLGIQVHPDKSVKVIAPEGSALKKIKEKVQKKASWILRQQDFFLSFHPLTPPRKYVSGETHLYLGRQYRLKIHKRTSQCVRLSGGYFHVYAKNPENKDVVKRILKAWYKMKADYHFHNLLEEKAHLAEKLYGKKPDLVYRWMDKRWGSCDKNGRIHLNLELIKAPKKCIEYVIVHELCHLKYLNHSPAFFELLSEVYPNWEATKDRLERLMV